MGLPQLVKHVSNKQQHKREAFDETMDVEAAMCFQLVENLATDPLFVEHRA